MRDCTRSVTRFTRDVEESRCVLGVIVGVNVYPFYSEAPTVLDGSSERSRLSATTALDSDGGPRSGDDTWDRTGAVHGVYEAEGSVDEPREGEEQIEVVSLQSGVRRDDIFRKDWRVVRAASRDRPYTETEDVTRTIDRPRSRQGTYLELKELPSFGRVLDGCPGGPFLVQSLSGRVQDHQDRAGETDR